MRNGHKLSKTKAETLHYHLLLLSTKEVPWLTLSMYVFSGVPGPEHGAHEARRLGGEREGDDGRAAPRAPPLRLCRRRVQGAHAARHEARQEPQVAGEYIQGGPQGWGSSPNDHQSPVHQFSHMGGLGTRYRSSVKVLTMPES